VRLHGEGRAGRGVTEKADGRQDTGGGLLCGTHGELEAARVVARLLGAVCEHGEDRVRVALEAAISQHPIEMLDLPAHRPKIDNVAVPDALAAYVVEAGRASDYDHLPLADGAVHE
jgi:hypothetical protein